jgi:hypothetical protein
MTLWCCVLVACFTSSPPLEPPARQLRKPGIWEFGLRKLNPANVDYGAELERRRQMFIHQFHDPRLWARATFLGSMLAGWAVVVRQRREKLRREILTSEILAQYHNALAETRIRLEQAIADNTALCEAAQTAAASSPLEPPAADHSVSPAELYLGSNFSPARARRPSANAAQSLATSARLAALEQQLSESRAREKLLEKELERIPAERRSSPLRSPPATSPRGKTPL